MKLYIAVYAFKYFLPTNDGEIFHMKKLLNITVETDLEIIFYSIAYIYI